MERSQPKYRTKTVRAAGSVDQLDDHTEQEFLSSAPKKPRAERKSDTQDQLIEENKMDSSKNDADSSNQLCNLPEELLLQILSFLPEEDALRTSILSKRWRHLWALVPDLQFTYSESRKSLFFFEYMRRACALRRGLPIRSFSLNCIGCANALPHILKMVASFMTTCGVRNLFLRLPENRGAHNLHSVFRCGTLEELNLLPGCILSLPYSICLSNLKVLSLSYAKFVDDDSAEKLFSSPLLENLVLHECSWKECNKIRILAPKLKYLSITPAYVRNGFSFDRQVHINANCLKSFHYSGSLLDEYNIFGDTSQLVESSLGLLPCDRRDVVMANLVSARSFKLLSLNASKVKDLTLSVSYIQDDLATRYSMPLFSNLIKLTVGGSVGSPEAFKGLFALLRRCPQLRSLSFNREFYYSRVSEVRALLDPVPSCLLTELKDVSLVIDIRGTTGRCHQKQLSMVGLLLEMAVFLEELTVKFFEGYMKKEILVDYVTKFPKWSRNCRNSLQPPPARPGLSKFSILRFNRGH